MVRFPRAVAGGGLTTCRAAQPRRRRPAVNCTLRSELVLLLPNANQSRGFFAISCCLFSGALRVHCLQLTPARTGTTSRALKGLSVPVKPLDRAPETFRGALQARVGKDRPVHRRVARNVACQ